MIIWPTPRPGVKAAVDILRDAYPSTTGIGTKMPKTIPAQFVMINRAGGGQTNPRFDMVRLLIELWANTYDALEGMTATATAALRNAAGTTVAGDIFIHWWGNEYIVDYDDPAVETHRRRNLTGELQVSTRTVSGT